METATAEHVASAQVVDYKADSPDLCWACGQRRSRFFMRGTVRADRTHTLCFECYRAEVNKVRARSLTAPVSVMSIASPMPVPARLRGDSETFYRDVRQRLRRAQIAARHAVDGLTSTGLREVPAALQKVS
jgi:hypothetical protein